MMQCVPSLSAIFSKKRAFSWLLFSVFFCITAQTPVLAENECTKNGVTKFVEDEFAKLDTQYGKLLFANQEAAKTPSEAVPNLINDYRVYKCEVQRITTEAYAMLILGGREGKRYTISAFGCPKKIFTVPKICILDELSTNTAEYSNIQAIADTEIAKTKKVLLLSQKVSADRQEGSFISARLWALNAKLPILLNDLIVMQTEFGRLFGNIVTTIPQCSTGKQ